MNSNSSSEFKFFGFLIISFNFQHIYEQVRYLIFVLCLIFLVLGCKRKKLSYEDLAIDSNIGTENSGVPMKTTFLLTLVL